MTLNRYFIAFIIALPAFTSCRKVIDIDLNSAAKKYVIEGVKTTIPFHLQLMQHEDFRKGNFTTKFLESFKMK